MGAGDRILDDFENRTISPPSMDHPSPDSPQNATKPTPSLPLLPHTLMTKLSHPPGTEQALTHTHNHLREDSTTAALATTLTHRNFSILSTHHTSECIPKAHHRTAPGNEGYPDSPSPLTSDPHTTGLSESRDPVTSIERTLMAMLKGFTIGAGLKGGLSLFSSLARLVKSKSRRQSPGFDTKVSLAPVLDDALRYGLFVGSFAGAYCCLDEGIASLWGHERTAQWRALLAGATAGPALLLVDIPGGKRPSGTPSSHPGHTSLALYVLVRAAVLAVRCGIKSQRWGWLFRPLSYKHGDVALMCLSSSQILTAWLLEPSSLPPSYVSFLNKHGGKPGGVVEGLRALALGQGLITPQIASSIAQAWKQAGEKRASAASQAVASLLGVQGGVPSVSLFAEAVREAAGPLCEAVAAAGSVGESVGGKENGGVWGSSLSLTQSPCPLLHPGETCVPHFMRFVGSAYARAVMVYIPVYVVPALVVHRATWLKKPLSILVRTALGTARSSLFLAAYCSSAWLYTCTLHQLLGRCTPATLAAGTFPTGLAVLLEKKSRRMELALYCFSRAIESFFICTHKWGWLPVLLPHWLGRMRGSVLERVLLSTKTLDVCVLGCAASIIMHCYANERDVFRSKYLNVLDWVFGGPASHHVVEKDGKDIEKSVE